MRLMNKHLQKTLDELDFLKKLYKKEFAVEKPKYSKDYDKRLRDLKRALFERINKDVDKAASFIEVKQIVGRQLKDRVLLTKLHLVQQVLDLTNRDMESFAIIFALTGNETFSYKTIERAYEDQLVGMILHNLYVLSCGEPRNIDASSDGTGYSLTITKHYRTDKDENKEHWEEVERKEYIITSTIVDLKTKIYVSFATGFQSEMKLFEQAKCWLEKRGFTLDSITLDKYYSNQKTIAGFKTETKTFFIPKKNATIRGDKKWKDSIKEFTADTMGYLKKYYKRETSEYCHSADKRRFGVIRQRKKCRIITTMETRMLLHNYIAKTLHPI
jgi:transposase